MRRVRIAVLSSMGSLWHRRPPITCARLAGCDNGRVTSAGGSASVPDEYAYGCWRIDVRGRPASGATPMGDRADPLLTAAMTVLAANKQARLAGVLATVGRMETTPGRSDCVAEGVSLWLDVRAVDSMAVEELAAAVSRQARERAERDGTRVEIELVERGRRRTTGAAD
jgi:metal-dependent amidase/aminoacylase/carboxypeptidase family protein